MVGKADLEDVDIDTDSLLIKEIWSANSSTIILNTRILEQVNVSSHCYYTS